MTNANLFVPMVMDVLLLNQATTPATPYQTFQMGYQNLKSFTTPEPKPFADQSSKTSPTMPAGVYLHWTLPRALRQGVIDEQTGGATFEYIPNRWLIVRLWAGASAKEDAVKAWVLESDAIDDHLGASPYIHPTKTPPNTPPVATQIGMVHPLTENLTIDNSGQPFLRAVGPGSVWFSIYFHGVENVLAFYDDLTDADGKNIDKANITYYVAGWYGHPSHDPLVGTSWQARDDNPHLFANSKFTDWLVCADSAVAIPVSMVVHSTRTGLTWDRTGHNVPPANMPTDLSKNVKVALGNTPLDALAAIVALTQGEEGHQEASLLEAFSYGLLDAFDQPGYSERLNIEIRKNWYGKSPGGTEWRVVPTPRTRDTATPAPPVPPFSAAQRQALADLNKAQRDLDREERILESMQWNLFSLWWKANYQTQNKIPDTPATDQWGDKLRGWFGDHMKHEGVIPGTPAVRCNHPGGKDPSEEQWYICQVQAKTNRVNQLKKRREAKHQALKKLLSTNLTLKASGLSPYYHPTDPVLLVTGLGRSTNLDPIGPLICRLASQLVTRMTITGSSYCVSGICDHNIAAQIPPLVNNSLLPADISTLQEEAFFLAPGLFAQDVGGGLQSQVVQAAIEALPTAGKTPSLTPDSQFAPEAIAFGQWKQPWIPLLLEWKVAVLSKPAYTLPDVEDTVNIPTPRLDPSNWHFDGTRYTWPDQDTLNTFSEAAAREMILSGRTFVTPDVTFTLADQLDQYVKTHQMRDPNLQKLMADLDQYLDGIKKEDILAQRLGGMLAQMGQRHQVSNVSPLNFDAVKDLVGDQYHGYPKPSSNNVAQKSSVPFTFLPFTGTCFALQKLYVVDVFGRVVDLMRANYSENPNQKDKHDENCFYPIVAPGLKTRLQKEPTATQTGEADLAQRVVQLPPTLIQDSRLNIELTSNDGRNEVVTTVAEASPVCGWFLPNHIDRSLAVYAPDGTAWGEAYLSKHVSNRHLLAWQPDPTNPTAPQTMADLKTANPYIYGIFNDLAQRGDNGEGFSDFLRVIDESLWGINPRGRRKDQDLSVLIGRPLAVVRTSLTLAVKGLPYTNQDWWNVYQISGAAEPDRDTFSPYLFDTGGIESHSWPVRLGSRVLSKDGLIGYYVDDPQHPDPTDSNNTTFTTFNSVYQIDSQSGYLKPIGEDNYVSLRFIDDSLATPDPSQDQVHRLTLLLDSRGSMHAFTGLLPTVELTLPDRYVVPALAKMYYLFRAGPFLTAPEAVRIPAPAENKGTWTWFDNVLQKTVAAQKADDKARLPAPPPIVKEGWLKFTPNPKNKS